MSRDLILQLAQQTLDARAHVRIFTYFALRSSAFPGCAARNARGRMLKSALQYASPAKAHLGRKQNGCMRISMTYCMNYIPPGAKLSLGKLAIVSRSCFMQPRPGHYVRGLCMSDVSMCQDLAAPDDFSCVPGRVSS